MIVIPGSQPPLNPAELSEEERKIYRLKESSPVRYTYDNAAQLRFELAVRASTIQAARDLEASNASFATFKGSRCNSDFWDRTTEGGFQLRTDVTPADAIRDIFKNGKKYAFECATAMVICLYRAVLDNIGEAAFNRYFASLFLYDWHYDSDLQLITTQGSNSEAMPGDVLYFVNPDVSPASMQWQGENVIKLDEDLYYGHGIGIKSAAGIIDKLNKHRKKNSDVSASLKDQTSHPEYNYLLSLKEGNPQQDARAVWERVKQAHPTAVTVLAGQRITVLSV